VGSTFTAPSWQPWFVWIWTTASLGLPGIRFLDLLDALVKQPLQEALCGVSRRDRRLGYYDLLFLSGTPAASINERATVGSG
jgi:hypothetical protein